MVFRNNRIADRQAADRAAIQAFGPPGMLAGNIIQIVVGNVHAGCRRVRQRPGGAENTEAGGDAVADIEVIEIEAGNAAVVVHDDLNRGPPAVTPVVAAAADDRAPLRDVDAAERERNRESGAEKDAAAVGQVREK